MWIKAGLDGWNRRELSPYTDYQLTLCDFASFLSNFVLQL